MQTTSTNLFTPPGFTRTAQETLGRATDAVANYKGAANEAARAGDEFAARILFSARAIAAQALTTIEAVWTGACTDPQWVWVAVDLLDDAAERAAEAS